jgi:putative FmdB family regulatory protein
MPIYAYKCGSCGHAKDVLQKISDAPLTVCPACGAEAFSKQLTAPGFQLKGSGWYATDFKNSGSKPAASLSSSDSAQLPQQLQPCPCARQFLRLTHTMSALRKWLIAGLLVIVPLVITLGVLNWIIGTLDQTLAILPEAWQPDRLLGMHIPGFGVILTLLILLLVGGIASNFIGRKLVGWGDALVRRIPWCAPSIPASSRSRTPCSPTAATLFARRCWCSGRARAYGPWLSSPASPAAKWRLAAR